MNAVLITIGDEILSGNTIDTNSNFIAQELRGIGIKVVQIFTISDEIETIKTNLKSAFDIADLVITTGGLGPTRDDKTKKAFAEFFDDKLVVDPTTFEHLKKILEKKNRLDLLEINTSQAEILSKGTVIQNENGTAPCQMVEANGKIVFCLPGVPYEVKPLIKDKIIPILQQKLNLNFLETKIISVVGIAESLLALQIEDWELSLPSNLSLSYLPVGNRIKLRISGSGNDKNILKNEIEEEFQKLEMIIGNNIISKDGDKIQDILHDILIAKNLTISSSESCTGGAISRLITSVSGSSNYFFGGICTYKTSTKVEILNVSEKLINEQTVVSEEVAKEMAIGCQKLFGTDIAVSTTGVAGPKSDDFNNDVGLAYYSIKIFDDVQTFKVFLPYMEREDFMDFVAQKVIQHVVELLVRH